MVDQQSLNVGHIVRCFVAMVTNGIAKDVLYVHVNLPVSTSTLSNKFPFALVADGDEKQRHMPG